MDSEDSSLSLDTNQFSFEVRHLKKRKNYWLCMGIVNKWKKEGKPVLSVSRTTYHQSKIQKEYKMAQLRQTALGY